MKSQSKRSTRSNRWKVNGKSIKWKSTMCVCTRSWVHHETRKQKKTRNESVRKEKKRNKNQKASSCRIDRLSYVAKNIVNNKRNQNLHTRRDSNPRSLIHPPGIPPLDHARHTRSIWTVRFFTYLYCCSERSSRYCCRYPRSILFPLRFSLSSILHLHLIRMCWAPSFYPHLSIYREGPYR